MRILTFATTDPDAPEAYRAAAVLFHDDWSRSVVAPILARTEEIAREAAEQFIAQDAAIRAKKHGRPAKVTPRQRREEPAPLHAVGLRAPDDIDDMPSPDEHGGAPDGDRLGYLQTAPRAPRPPEPDFDEEMY